MAMYDEKWKQAEAARIAKNRAGAVSTAGSVGNWAIYGGAQPGPAKPMFTAPDYTKPNPTNQPVMTAAVAKPAIGAVTAPTPPATASAKLPMPNFANVAGGSKTSYGPPANPARRPGSQAGAGAPSAAGTAALRPGDPNTFTGSNGVTRPVPGTMAAASNPVGSVQSQNFGNAAVPQPQAGIARPGAVASTLGQSVRTMPDDNVVAVQRPNVAMRGPDAMAEQYNAREDREASKALASQLDSERFRLELVGGNNSRRGRAAIAALGENAQQRAALAGGAAQLSAGAVQGRENRDNQFGIAEMGEQGDQRRAELDFQAAQMGDSTERYKADLSAIERPSLQVDANGNLLSVAGTRAANVVGADGQPVRGQVQKAADTGAVQPKDALAAVNKELASLVNNPPELGVDATEYNARVAALRAQQSAYLNGGAQQTQAAVQTATNPKTGEKMRLNPQTQQWEPVK